MRTRSALLRLSVPLLATLLLSGLGAALAPKIAWATTAVIIEPTEEGDYEPGYAGPMTVSLADAQAGTYTFSITGPESYSWEASDVVVEEDGSSGEFSRYFKPIDVAGTYTASVADPDGSVLASVDFVVTRPQTSAAITQPTDGGTYESGYTGPMVVDIANAQEGTYIFTITGPDYYSWIRGVSVSEDGVYSEEFPAVASQGTYTALIQAPDGTDLDSAQFDVYLPPAADILDPVDGTAFETGYTGPMVAEIRNAQGGTYTFSITGPDYFWQTGVSASGNRVYSRTFAPLSSSGTYIALVQAPDGSELDSTEFEILRPPAAVKVLSASLSRNTIYSTVQDGHRDSTTVRFVISQDASVIITIRDSKGKTVRKAELGKLRANRQHSWNWRGRNNKMKQLSPGLFRITVGARANGKVGKSKQLEVRIRTKLLTFRKTLTRYGSNPSKSWRTRYCYRRFRWWSNSDLFLDCWGGNQAGARYDFLMARDAFNARYRVYGRLHCCRPGYRTIDGVRKGRKAFVYVTVGGWRAYDITKVSVSYSYHRRI